MFETFPVYAPNCGQFSKNSESQFFELSGDFGINTKNLGCTNENESNKNGTPPQLIIFCKIQIFENG